MSKSIISIFFLAFVLFLSGCGTKRQYFEPANINGKIKPSGSISSDLQESARNGAVLENGRVITIKSEEKSIGLEKHESFFGEFDGKFISASNNGKIRVKNKDGLSVFGTDLNIMIASASVKEEILAVITSDNTLYAINMDTNTTIFQKKMDVMAAVDSRIAAPYFLGNLIIFPTLDGKLAIVDARSGTLVRSVVISGEREFNNVIFLDVLGDRMFASTSKRIIGISPDNVNYIDEDIKDALVSDERVFVFTKDGRVLLCDLELKVLSEKKFPFAIFAAVAAKNKLYILEKRGYLIKSDLELKEFEIFEFTSQIDDFLFMTKDAIFYKNKFYILE
ncbi:MAG: PQQ-like beta-propeller repeat protein [Campylobacteraceae bacterium]|jgi:outer membrane protein assembly factor BamB|nr:PQQ-like beta-propeller repeat protein [Campylobacteraceae bacterium]